MTQSKRREVAATLRRWAAWCDQCPHNAWDGYPHETRYSFESWDAAYHWCEDRGKLFDEARMHAGPTAALALCFAAAMVEAGDSV
jgi:hypothetical protein